MNWRAELRRLAHRWTREALDHDEYKEEKACGQRLALGAGDVDAVCDRDRGHSGSHLELESGTEWLSRELDAERELLEKLYDKVTSPDFCGETAPGDDRYYMCIKKKGHADEHDWTHLERPPPPSDKFLDALIKSTIDGKRETVPFETVSVIACNNPLLASVTPCARPLGHEGACSTNSLKDEGRP